MPRDLPSHLWVAALLRRAQVGGAFAVVAHRGDPERGDVLVKVVAGRDRAQLYAPAFVMDGPATFERLPREAEASNEAEIDALVQKRLKSDRDLWVVEIEDRDLRHFLTERIED